MVNEADGTDIALGYFSVSSISKKKLTIPVDQTVRGNSALIKEGDCRKAFTNATLDRPSGWE